jgi:hypothetical protein
LFFFFQFEARRTIEDKVRRVDWACGRPLGPFCAMPRLPSGLKAMRAGFGDPGLRHPPGADLCVHFPGLFKAICEK